MLNHNTMREEVVCRREGTKTRPNTRKKEATNVREFPTYVTVREICFSFAICHQRVL